MGEINNDDDWRNGLDISGLSLMEEDDSLLLLFPDPTSGTDKEGLDWFGEDELSEVMKYNLRKSLAWDKAFFTNAGVLEPDELCHMIESNHVGEKKVLATIQEDVKRSTESISTLKSDCTLETSEGCDKSKELGERDDDDAVHSPTPSTLDDRDSNEKVKPNGIRKRPSIRAQGLGKVTKQATEHNTSSISRPSTGLSRSVRASVDVNKTKQGESSVAPRVAISRRIRPTVSKPGPPSKSAFRSSKNELTSSCSSLESCISASSSACKKSPLESANQKKSQSSRTAFHSMANGSTSRAASRVSPLSATSTFKSRLSSNNAAFLSASVDWSFNSPRAPTPNKMAKGKKKTVSAVQHDPMPDQHGSMTKPTGLRVPSPKLGYFDGGRSSVARTPTGSCTGGSAKHGARSLNEPTASSRTKSRLVQESTNSKAKARPVSRSSRLIVSASASSPKVTSKTYSKVSAEERLNGDAVEDNLAQ